MPMYVQVCNGEVIEVFENETLENVKKGSQEWANATNAPATVYEVVATMEFEPEEKEEEEDEDDDGVPA